MFYCGSDFHCAESRKEESRSLSGGRSRKVSRQRTEDRMDEGKEGLKKYYRFRRTLILASLLVMMVISIYQYSWSLFAYALARELAWDLATIGLTFTVFNYTSTLIQPFSGFISDSLGPRKVALIASVLVGLGFILSSFSSSPGELYLFYGLGSLGVGILYGVSTANAIKWFPDKRGFATGLVVFGFGAGTAIFNALIQVLLESKGFRATFIYTGSLMLLLLIPASLFYRYPPKAWTVPSLSAKKAPAEAADYTPLAMLRTYQWFLIYFCFSFTVSIVLLFAAQMKMVAKEFHLPKQYFDLLLVMFPLGNGLSRILAGVVSDRLGREKTMMIFYSCLGLSILSLVKFGGNPLFFVLIVFLAALLGGSPFVLYPATIGDYYGARYATSNYGITYTAKAWAGLISGWVSGYFVTNLGSFKIPLILIGAASLLAGLFSNPGFMRAPGSKPGAAK